MISNFQSYKSTSLKDASKFRMVVTLKMNMNKDITFMYCILYQEINTCRNLKLWKKFEYISDLHNGFIDIFFTIFYYTFF
jgi:hypothetical protein